MPLSAIIVDNRDNVATALRPLDKGEKLNLSKERGNLEIVLTQAIPMGHKFAISPISKGTPVFKYGEVIGQATVKISPGQHVHVHNVEGLRGRGDRH